MALGHPPSPVFCFFRTLATEKSIFREKNGCTPNYFSIFSAPAVRGAYPGSCKRPGWPEPKILVIRWSPNFLIKIVGGTPIYLPKNRLFVDG